jgi:putative ATP-binding cassette transporter
MMFMPQRPYLPPGTLRAALSYPAEASRFDASVGAALERVDLAHLAPSLDRDERWDRKLSLDEQQRLAFARLLLHAPRWVFLDDAIGALSEDHRQLVFSIFEQELAGAAVLRFGRDRAPGSWDRTLHVILRPGEPCLPAPPIKPEAAAVSAAVTSTGATSGSASAPAAKVEEDPT